MRIELGTVRESPFVGIFAVATEKWVLAPAGLSQKEEKVIGRAFGLEVVKAVIANSTLLGVLSAGNSKGIVAGNIIEEREKQALEQSGIRVMVVDGVSAVGNHLAANDTRGICSGVFSGKQVKEIEGFLKVKLMKTMIAGTDVVGSSIVLTNKGFVLNRMASPEEANAIEKHLGVEGIKGTANSGDCFVGNSIVANSEAAIAGFATTGFELSRIDEGLRG